MIGAPWRAAPVPATIAMLIVAVLVGACGTDPTGPPVASPAATPTAVAASPDPTPEPTSAATPAPDPVAEIVTRAGTIAGALGTYTVDGRGSDAPWLPFDGLPALDVDRGTAIVIRFVDGVAIGEGSIVLAAAEDTAGAAPLAVDGVRLNTGGASLTAGPLPAGRWVLMARLFRADGRGDGLTYWALTVR